jgi:predicted Zn-dependent peptidase
MSRAIAPTGDAGRALGRARASVMVLAALLAGAVDAGAIEIPVVESRLANGLRLLVHEDHTLPVAASYLFYGAGSANEQVGRTGMAHLFEHMMFNGSRRYGPGTFDNLIEGAGGSTNGYTAQDFTVYLNDFPPEALDLVLDLEADRMAHLLVTERNLEQERGIVKEERRLRVDNVPMATMYEQMCLLAFVESPYRWPVVGFMADLDAITLESARAYLATYYVPNNATLIIAGDLETAAVQRAVERAFGRIPAGTPPPEAVNAEAPQLGARRALVHRQAELAAVLIGYPAVEPVASDRAALDVLDVLLSRGESSRLHRRLVYEEELATTTWSDYTWLRHGGVFVVYAQARPGASVERVEREILAIVAGAGQHSPEARELRKAKNILLASHLDGLETVGGRADQLGSYDELFGDYRALFRVESEWEAVTPEDVARVARTYLVPRKSTTVVLIPESAG